MVFLGRVVVAMFFCLVVSSVSLARTTDKREIRPEVTYRMGSLDINRESAYHTSSHNDFLDQLYLTIKYVRTFDYVNRVVIEPAIRTKRNNPDKIDTENLIDQGYVESELGGGFGFTAGKKVEYRGSGYFVNPSDLLNEKKDLYDSLYQRTGRVFARVNWGNDWLYLGLGFIPLTAQAAGAGKAWLVSTMNIWNTDIVLQQTYNELDKGTTGLSVSRFFGDHVELHTDARWQMRQRSRLEFEERAYALSYGASLDDSVKDANNQVLDQSDNKISSAYYLLGTRLVMTPRRTIIGEYFTNQSGLLPGEFKLFMDDVRSRATEGSVIEPPGRPLLRHYAFASYQDEDSIKNLLIGFSYLANLDDQSQFLSATLRYTLSPATSVEYSPLVFAGSTGTPETSSGADDGIGGSEFGEMPFRVVNYLIFRGRF